MNAKDLLVNMALAGAGGGGVTPTGTLTITENGEYDVTEKAGVDVCVPLPSGKITISANANDIDVSQYATADVNVPAQGGLTWEDALSGTQTSLTLNIPAGSSIQDTIPREMFFGKTTLTSLDFYCSTTGKIDIKAQAFQGTTNLNNVALKGQNIYVRDQAFLMAGLSGTLDFSGVKSVGSSSFRMTGMTNAVFSKLETIDNGAFQQCASLAGIEFSNSLSSIGSQAFYGCKALTALIIRSTGRIPTLSYNSFDGSSIASGTGFIYITDDYVDTLKAATNWSTYASQILPLSQLPA